MTVPVELGAISWMVRATKAPHVWKHFYDPAERWQIVAEANPAELYQQALAAGCPEFEQDTDAPRPLAEQVESLLRHHHDQAYGPAYLNQLGKPDTRWARKKSDSTRWAALSTDHVLAFVQEGAPSVVCTAMRPHPQSPSVSWGEKDTRQHARWKFDKETGVKLDRVETVRRLLTDYPDEPASPNDVWWIALAVGLGTDLKDERLTRARAALATSPHRAGIEADVLDSGILDRLGAALQQADPEDLLGVLSDLEDRLLVADGLGLAEQLQPLSAQAHDLLAWLPDTAEPVLRQAEARAAALPEECLAASLWSHSRTSILDARLRSLAPMKPSTWADKLLGEPRKVTLVDRARKLATTTLGIAIAGLDELAASLTARPLVAMDSTSSTPASWPVRAATAKVPAHVRAFGIEPGSAIAHEVTDQVRAGLSVWTLDTPGSEVTLILVASLAPVPGATLPEVLAAADAAGARVVVTTVARPR